MQRFGGDEGGRITRQARQMSAQGLWLGARPGHGESSACAVAPAARGNMGRQAVAACCLGPSLRDARGAHQANAPGASPIRLAPRPLPAVGREGS